MAQMSPGNTPVTPNLASLIAAEATLARSADNLTSGTVAAARVGDLSATYALAAPAIPALSLAALPTHLNNHFEYNGYAVIRDNVVTLANGTQYAAWWDNRGHPIIGKRVIPDGLWTTFDLSTVTGNPLASPVLTDGHNNISVGVDPAGYIHVSGNHHAVPLNYTRSTNPNDITAWVTPGMVGTNEDLVSYPQFVTLPNGTFLFFYRNGVSGDGDLFLNKFNTTTRVWTRVSNPAQGTGLTPNESPYPNQPMVAADGTLGLFITYRTTSQANGNHDIGYMKSTDGGVTWTDISGNALTLPVKSTNTTSGGTGSFLPLAWTGINLINSSGAALDSKGRPHCAIWLSNVTMNLHHIWWNGSAWQDETVLSLTNAQAGTTDITQIARVSTVCTNNGRTLLIYRITADDPSGMWVRDVTPLIDGITRLPTFKLADIDLGGYEPTYDYQAVRTLNQLHMLITPLYRAGLPLLSGPAAYMGQWGAILSVDLSQIGLLASGSVPPPVITRIMRSSAAASSSSATPADVATAVPYLDKNFVVLARLLAGATGGSGTISLRQRPANSSAQIDLAQVAVSGNTAAATTTTTAGSNGVRAASFNGAGTLNVASTTGFTATGTLLVTVGNPNAADAGSVYVNYTGLTGTTFTGCSTDMAAQSDNVQFLTGNTVQQGPVAMMPWQPVRPDLGDLSAGYRLVPRIAAGGGSTLTVDSVATELAMIGQPGKPLFYTAPRGLVPASLANCAYWKVSALALGNGAAVSAVPDSGSAANALSQATGGLQPTFNTTGINSKPALAFTGAQLLDGISAVVGTRGFTIICVAASTATPAGGQVIVASDDSGANATRLIELRYNTSATVVDAFGFDSPAAAVFATSPTLSPTAPTPRVFTVQRSAGIIQLWINGQLSAQTTTASSVPNGGAGVMHVGGRRSGNNTTTVDFLTGFIGDIIVTFGEPMTFAERKAAESLLATTYGITLP